MRNLKLQSTNFCRGAPTNGFIISLSLWTGSVKGISCNLLWTIYIIRRRFHGNKENRVHVQSVRQEGNAVCLAGEADAGEMPPQHRRGEAPSLDGEPSAGELT